MKYSFILLLSVVCISRAHESRRHNSHTHTEETSAVETTTETPAKHNGNESESHEEEIEHEEYEMEMEEEEVELEEEMEYEQEDQENRHIMSSPYNDENIIHEIASTLCREMISEIDHDLSVEEYEAVEASILPQLVLKIKDDVASYKMENPSWVNDFDQEKKKMSLMEIIGPHEIHHEEGERWSTRWASCEYMLLMQPLDEALVLLHDSVLQLMKMTEDEIKMHEGQDPKIRSRQKKSKNNFEKHVSNAMRLVETTMKTAMQKIKGGSVELSGMTFDAARRLEREAIVLTGIEEQWIFHLHRNLREHKETLSSRIFKASTMSMEFAIRSTKEAKWAVQRGTMESTEPTVKVTMEPVRTTSTAKESNDSKSSNIGLILAAVFIPLGLIGLMVVFGYCPILTNSDSKAQSREDPPKPEANEKDVSNDETKEATKEAPQSSKAVPAMPVLTEPQVAEQETPEVQPIVTKKDSSESESDDLVVEVSQSVKINKDILKEVDNVSLDKKAEVNEEPDELEKEILGWMREEMKVRDIEPENWESNTLGKDEAKLWESKEELRKAQDELIAQLSI